MRIVDSNSDATLKSEINVSPEDIFSNTAKTDVLKNHSSEQELITKTG